MVLETKNYKAQLVEVIIKSFIGQKHEDLVNELGNRLNESLKFTTTLSTLEQENNFTVGYVVFKDTLGNDKCIDFKITNV